MARRTQRPIPTAMTPSRAAVYHRVSSEEQVEGYSLDAQQRATTAYCQAHGWDLIREYRDEGKSAWSDDLAKRPAFARMVADAEAGLVDVVVVHKLDRFSRNLLTTLETLQRLEAVGVGFVSISESMDFTTPIGKVILATLGAFAEYYSANLSAETKKGKSERKKQGLYNGHLPFGTAKGEDGVPIPHPEHHAALVLAFELAAAGRTDREVAQALNVEGYRTNGNRGANPFSKDTVRVILQNRFYLGELPDGSGGHVPGRHEAILDQDLFARAQRARAANTSRPIREGRGYQPWGLSGLATCAECGASITVHGRSDGRKRLRCAGRGQGNGCGAPTFFADVAEDQLGDVLGRFAVPEADRGPLLTLWRRSRRRDGDSVAERARIERRQARLHELYLDEAIDRAAYQRQRADLADELAALPPDRAEDGATGERLAGFLADVAGAWRVATPAERNRLARQLLSGAVVENKTVVAVVPRPEVAAFFALVEVGEKSGDAAPGEPGDGVQSGVSAEVTGFGPTHAPRRRGSSWSGCRRRGARSAPPVGRRTRGSGHCNCRLRSGPPFAPLPTPRVCAPSPPTSASATRPCGACSGRRRRPSPDTGRLGLRAAGAAGAPVRVAAPVLR